MVLDLLNNQFPFGKIEQISEMGLVQKVDKSYVKDSADRLIGYLPTNKRHPKFSLYEMKARVAASIAQEERERVVLQHHGEKYVSTHFYSPTSWQYVSKPSERLQILHHCYLYEETRLLHVADGTQQILSGVLTYLDLDLLESNAKLLGRLYSLSLQPFYQAPNLTTVLSIAKVRIVEGISIHKKQLVNYTTVNQRHML